MVRVIIFEIALYTRFNEHKWTLCNLEEILQETQPTPLADLKPLSWAQRTIGLQQREC